jgi:hypothetical protein
MLYDVSFLFFFPFFPLILLLFQAYSNTPQVPFPPGMTGPHAIVQMGTDPTNMYGAFAWQFQLIAADGELLTWGRHTYLVQDLGDGSTNISSFEKVAGPQVDQYAYAWTGRMVLFPLLPLPHASLYSLFLELLFSKIANTITFQSRSRRITS